MSTRPNNLTDAARDLAKQSRYHTDRAGARAEKIAPMVLAHLRADRATPVCDVVAAFEVAAAEQGIGATWRGKSGGIVRNLLRSLESDGAVVRVRYTDDGTERVDHAWALPPFVPPAPRIVQLLDARARRPAAGESVSIACLQREIAQVRAQLNRMEAQLAALVAK